MRRSATRVRSLRQRLARLGATAAFGLAVDLVRGAYPRPSASTGADPERLHEAVDGRVWFFDEVANGWTNAGSHADWDWFAVDFGRPTPTGAAELYFADAGRTTAPPQAYRLEVLRDGVWAERAGVQYEAAQANGVTRVRWPNASFGAARVVLRPAPGRAVRLVELKVF